MLLSSRSGAKDRVSNSDPTQKHETKSRNNPHPQGAWASSRSGSGANNRGSGSQRRHDLTAGKNIQGSKKNPNVVQTTIISRSNTMLKCKRTSASKASILKSRCTRLVAQAEKSVQIVPNSLYKFVIMYHSPACTFHGADQVDWNFILRGRVGQLSVRVDRESFPAQLAFSLTTCQDFNRR